MDARFATVGALLLVIAGACGGSPRATRVATPPRTTTTSSSVAPATTTTTPLPTTFPTAACVPPGSWTVARLAAQTVIVPAEETNLAAVTAEVAAGAGGVILFGAAAPADLASQIRSLDAAAPDHLGVLVATDEEGGGVQRLANLVGSLPWASYAGTHWTTEEIRAQVAAVARRMAALGVDADLAPVVDVDARDVAPGPDDPDGWRSFGGTTSLVSADGVAFMRGLEDGGVLAVLKHFPGLGGASANTDNGAATTLPWSVLMRTGLPPFIEGIEDGAQAVMVSNAIVPGLTTIPASLSPLAINGELVGHLHFGGLIIDDSLSAGAISAAGFSVAGAAVQALRAGADMVMYTASRTPDATKQQFDAIVGAVVSAVADGRLARSRLVSAATAALTTRHASVCP